MSSKIVYREVKVYYIDEEKCWRHAHVSLHNPLFIVGTKRCDNLSYRFMVAYHISYTSNALDEQFDLWHSCMHWSNRMGPMYQPTLEYVTHAIRCALFDPLSLSESRL